MEPEVRTRTFFSESPEATEALAEALAGPLVSGALLALEGELGAGKTAFVRGLARGLGVTEPVTSPTFTLMHEMEGRLPLFHFDAWMEGREVLFLEGGGAEYLSGPGVAAVEWADQVRDWLPAPRLEVVLSHLAPERRRIVLRLIPDPRTRTSPLQDALEAAFEAPGAGSGLEEAPDEENGRET